MRLSLIMFFLEVILLIIVFFGVIFLVLYKKLKKLVSVLGFNSSQDFIHYIKKNHK